MDHRHSGGVLCDYCDGEAYKSHPLYSTHVNSLQILLYYDELEVCNPLGSSKTKHKLGESSIYMKLMLCVQLTLCVHVSVSHLCQLHSKLASVEEHLFYI